jgi:hypothetical protein
MRNFFITTVFLLFLSCNTKTKTNDKTTADKNDRTSGDKFITQSAKHLKHGDDLEIRVQLEPLNDTLNPRVQIDSIDVPINSNGLVMYVKTISDTSGKHSIPVSIIHRFRNRADSIATYIVNYTIDK